MAVQVKSMHPVAVRDHHPLHQFALAGSVCGSIGVDAPVERLVLPHDHEGVGGLGVARLANDQSTIQPTEDAPCALVVAYHVVMVVPVAGGPWRGPPLV